MSMLPHLFSLATFFFTVQEVLHLLLSVIYGGVVVYKAQNRVHIHGMRQRPPSFPNHNHDQNFNPLIDIV